MRTSLMNSFGCPFPSLWCSKWEPWLWWEEDGLQHVHCWMVIKIIQTRLLAFITTFSKVYSDLFCDMHRNDSDGLDAYLVLVLVLVTVPMSVLVSLLSWCWSQCWKFPATLAAISLVRCLVVTTRGKSPWLQRWAAFSSKPSLDSVIVLNSSPLVMFWSLQSCSNHNTIMRKLWILLKQNTALLSTSRMYVAGATS